MNPTPKTFQEPVERPNWQWPILVRCPRCDARASIDQRPDGKIGLRCLSCAFVKDQRHWSEPLEYERWLQTYCCGGEVLWANNEEHLDYLEGFVGGKLRKTNLGESQKPLSSKLPTWMKTAKHREEVLRAIERLRSTLT